MNDTTTAVMCINGVGTILASLGSRPFGSPYRRIGGSLWLVIVITDFATLVHEAFDQIRRSASDNVAILLRIAGTIEMLGTLPVHPGRYAAFAEQLGLLDEISELTVATAADRAAIQRRIGEVRRSLVDACAKAAAGTKPNKGSILRSGQCGPGGKTSHVPLTCQFHYATMAPDAAGGAHAIPFSDNFPEYATCRILLYTCHGCLQQRWRSCCSTSSARLPGLACWP